MDYDGWADELSWEEKDLLLWGWELKYPALNPPGREPQYSRRMRRERRMRKLQARVIPQLQWLYSLANFLQPAIMTYLTVRGHR